MKIESILIVDDDHRTCELLSAFLSSSSFVVSFAYSGHEAAALMQRRKFDLVITDLCMPDGDGIDVISRIRRAFARTLIIAMTGPWVVRVEDYLNQAKSLSVDGILMKPFLQQQVLTMIRDLQRVPTPNPSFSAG